MVGFRRVTSISFAIIVLCLCAASATDQPKPIFTTYLGGTGFDEAFAVAIDSKGNTYIAGIASPPNFPGRNQEVLGNDDVFVSKFSTTGELLYSTLLGGSGFDQAFGIAVDAEGNLYIVGNTSSTDFPIVNGFQPTYGGGNADAFLVKLDPSGTIIYSTYLGGSGNSDVMRAIALDDGGNAYVTGSTDSSDFRLKNVTTQSSYGGGTTDAFIAKVNTKAFGDESLVYSSYLGGFGQDNGNAIALDRDRNVYVAGSATPGFPTTVNAFQTYAGSAYFHGFLSKLSPIGSTLYSTVLGGNSNDVTRAIFVDDSGLVYLAGETNSSDFPVSAGAPQQQNGGLNAFVVKINPGLSGTAGLVYSTFFGEAWASGSGLAVDRLGSVHLAGYKCDSGTVLSSCGAFLIGLDMGSDGSAGLLYETVWNGSWDDEAQGLAFRAGRFAVVGYTDSGDLPTLQAFQNSSGGSRDAFVGILTIDSTAPLLTVPSGIAQEATTSSGAIVSYNVSAVDDFDPEPGVSCMPATGSTFPVGATTVNCSASDVSGNKAEKSFSITVKGANEQLLDLISVVESLQLAKGLTNSLETKLWSAIQAPVPGSCGYLNDFLSQVNAQSGKGILSDQAAQMAVSALRIKNVLGCK